MLEPPPRYFLTCCCCCNPQQCPTQHDIRAISGGVEILLPAGAKAPRLHTFARNSRNKLPQHEVTHAGMGTWSPRVPQSKTPQLASRSCPSDAEQLWRQSGDDIPPLSIRTKAPRLFFTQVFLRTSRNSRYRSWDLAFREPALRCSIPALPDADKLWRHGGGKIPLSIGTKTPRHHASLHGVQP